MHAELASERMMCLLLGTEDGYQVWNVTDVDNVTELLCSTSNRFRKVIFLKVIVLLIFVLFNGFACS